MTVSLNRYSASETGYVAKFNSDNQTIENALNAVENAIDVGTPTGTGGTAALDVLWDRNGMIGTSSFQVSAASQTLTVTSGAVWNLSQQKRGKATSSVTLNFGAKTSGIYYIIADGTGGLSISAASGSVPASSVALYQIEYKAPNFGSAGRLVEYLMDGEDYNRMLSGGVFGSHSRVADRLSAIEGAMTVDGLYAQSAASGLTWDYNAGHFRNNNAITSTAAGTVTLSASQTHYIEVAISDGSVSYATGGWTASTAIPIRFIETSTAEPISNNDVRTWATVPGGGGGVAGIANSGTTDGIWTLYRTTGAGSAPVSDAGVLVDRGSQATVEIRWNETDDQWEFTNDGTSYVAFGDAGSLNIGAGLQTRFTAVVSQPLVVNLAGTDPTSDTPMVAVTLSTYVSTTTTAVLLRGYMTDSNPQMSAASQLGIVFARDSATLTNTAAQEIFASPASQPVAATVVVPVSDQQCVYRIDASSDGSADIYVALVGFWDTVAGVGTQKVSATVASLSAAVSTTDWKLSATQFSAVMNRGLLHYLETSATMGAGSTYDVELYNGSDFSAGGLLFQALGIDASAAYVTRLPFHYEDTASTTHVHLRVSHNAASAGLISFQWRGEKFA